MSSEIENVPSTNDSEKLETIQLHRAESLPQGRAESLLESNMDIPEKEDSIKKEITMDYVSEQTLSCCASVGYMKIEVVMFLYMFSYILRLVSTTTMIMDKACLVHLKYSEEICKNLKNYTDIKDEVEKLANNYSLGHSLMHMIPSAVLAIFIGSWSDKYGRKLPILIALLGVILDGLGGSLCAAFFYSRIEFLYISSFISGFSGGVISVLTVIYSYASDTTTCSSRTLKYAIMEMIFGLSMPLGQLAGGWIYKFFGYPVVFMTSTAGHVIALVWIMFVIKETKGLDNEDSWIVKLRYLYSTQQVVDSFKATVKKRPNKGKEQILSLITAMSFVVMTYASTAGIGYIYAHHMYNWDNTKYSTISAIFSVVGTIAMLICVPILKKLNLGDPGLGLIGSISLLLKNVAIGLASTMELYFFANLAGLLGGLATLGCRTRISKVVSKNDIGKVFAFLTTSESLLPIMSTAVVSQIFNASLKFYPGFIYIILGILMLIPIGVFIWLTRLPNVNYEEMDDNTEPEEIPEKPTKEKQKETVKY